MKIVCYAQEIFATRVLARMFNKEDVLHCLSFGGLGGDITQGADGLEARADRGGLAFAEGQEDFGHGPRVAEG